MAFSRRECKSATTYFIGDPISVIDGDASSNKSDSGPPSVSSTNVDESPITLLDFTLGPHSVDFALDIKIISTINIQRRKRGTRASE